MTLRGIITILAFFAICSCVDSSRPSSSYSCKGIVEESLGLLEQYKEFALVEDLSCCQAIAAEAPKRVLVQKDGVYIYTKNGLFNDAGFFISRGKTKVDEGPGFDPSFEKICDGMYWFIVRG